MPGFCTAFIAARSSARQKRTVSGCALRHACCAALISSSVDVSPGGASFLQAPFRAHVPESEVGRFPVARACSPSVRTCAEDEIWLVFWRLRAIKLAHWSSFDCCPDTHAGDATFDTGEIGCDQSVPGRVRKSVRA